jgi:hypothetical protein
MARSHHPSRRPTADDRRFFDVLLFWRSVYAERGPQDSAPVISVARLMDAIGPDSGANGIATPAN